MKTHHCGLLALLVIPSFAAFAQQPVAAPAAATAKPRVFITDSESWETSGSAGGSNGTFAAQSHGGARPQTAEIIKTFGQRCSEVVINNRQDLADYVVVLDHEGGKGYLRHRNKVAVFDHLSGDAVMSKSTLSVGGSVEDACIGIVQHWNAHSSEILAARRDAVSVKLNPPSGTSTPMPVQPSSPTQSSITVDSAPVGADIEIDGMFVGNTPSTVNVAVGSHDVIVKKKGFVDWTRKMNVTGGTIHLNAELEAKP